APGARGEAIDPAYAEAVGHALAEAGFTLLRQPGHARYAAEITVTQEAHGSVIAEAPRRPPWVSGGTQSGRTGGSVSVPLPSGKGQVSTLVSTAIEIRIRQRADADDAAPRWSGRAATAQATGTREGAPAAVAAKLVGALFRNFPADSGLSISVP
ncbi:hypothetical protein, partial [Sphingomonas sp.]|uniref:hypothetical protein n=1 Tax=Sphingomonas sp. TaxID=28214 RepID=UPI002CB2E3F7